MKRTIDGRSTALTLPRASYEVGYGKPPVHSRFTKGQSGNPKGRPKGAKTRNEPAYTERLREIILEEAYRTIGVRDGVREVRVPMAQAIMRSLAVNAVKGQLRAQRLFAELLVMTEREKRREHWDLLEALFDYKRKWETVFDRRRDLGIQAPDPVPHPDQIRIDLRTGALDVRGPLTRQENAELETWKHYRRILEAGNESLAGLLAVGGCEELSVEEIEEQMRGNDTCIGHIDRMILTGRPWPLPALPEGLEL